MMTRRVYAFSQNLFGRDSAQALTRIWFMFNSLMASGTIVENPTGTSEHASTPAFKLAPD